MTLYKLINGSLVECEEDEYVHRMDYEALEDELNSLKDSVGYIAARARERRVED